MLPIGGNNAIVVAHPDDEVLFAGSLPLKYNSSRWTIICASAPSVDPERIAQFTQAANLLGARGVISTIPEVPGEPLSDLSARIPSLRDFDLVVTHNALGEYGHEHHKQVHEYVSKTYPRVRQAYFGYGRPRDAVTVEIGLTAREFELKLRALQAYCGPREIDGRPGTLHELLVRNLFGGDLIQLATETYTVAP